MWFWLIPTFITVATVSWYLGTVTQRKKEKRRDRRLRRDYFVGLNYLINEQPDKAVDIFIKILEVDTNTIETHLALGNLFRRRGEVDRAIRIHQNLIARPQLTKDERAHALLELGQDYMSAGVLDRAEKIFQELVSINEENLLSLNYLLNIYQQEKVWQKAIDVANQLQTTTNEDKSRIISHFYCELAVQALQKKETLIATQLLKKALTYNKKCVRALIMQAEILQADNQFKAAAELYWQVYQKDPRYFFLVANDYLACAKKIERLELALNNLLKTIEEKPNPDTLIIYAEALSMIENDYAAINFLLEQIKRLPSLRGLKRLIRLYIDNADSDTRAKLMILSDLLDRLLENRNLYRCSECGYGSKLFYWQCPGCKRWESFRALSDLEGE